MGITEILAISAAGFVGLFPAGEGPASVPPKPEPIVIVQTIVEYPDCQEDEDWATVHYETPGAVEDHHGVTRMCVPRDVTVMEAIRELVLDGTLIWEWDLPDEYRPAEYDTEGSGDE